MEELLRITTTDAPIGQRHRYWTSQVVAHLSTMEIDVKRKIDFSASIAIRSLGPARIALVDAEYQSVHHRADGHDDRLQLSLVTHGSIEVRRFGQMVTLGEGDWCLLDERENYSFETSARCSCIVLQMPGQWARRLIPDPGGPLIASKDCDPQWQGALAMGLRAVGGQTMRQMPADDTFVAEQLGNLMALAIGSQTFTMEGRHRGALMRSIRQSILQRHSESGLSAHDIAAQNRISLRYLHKLFAENDTTFSHELSGVRLASAKRMLGDPRYARVQLAEIAAMTGFATPEVFTRHFKSREGVTPRTYRAMRN